MKAAPDPTPSRAAFARYLLLFFAAFAGVLGLAWAYVASVPVAFMESGYASWAAKRAMLDGCQLGQIAFFGDSRLEAGLVPADLPVPATNFGLAAGTAVELRVAVDRALACPNRPRQVVLSLVPEHWGPLSRFYWLLSVRYGFLAAADVAAVRRLAAVRGDRDSLAAPTPEGLSGPVRDWLYVARFPSLSFGSLVAGRFAGRWGANQARIAAVEADRGWTAYAGGDPVDAGHPDRFVLTPLQDAEFRAALDALRAAGIPTAFLVMPFSTAHAETDDSFAAWRAYLESIPGLTVLDPAVPLLPPAAFADGAHLTAPAAHAFTHALATCLHDGLLQPPCKL